jgi:hypothetical protein
VAKLLFPKIKRGGYTCKLRFSDEGRGEMWFDTEWDMRTEGKPDRLVLIGVIDHRGFPVEFGGKVVDRLSVNVGDQVTVQPIHHTMRGRKFLPSRTITITQLAREPGFLTLDFE